MRSLGPEQRVRYVLSRRDFGAEVAVQGWVRSRRDSKGGFSFLDVNDGSCLAGLQVVAESALANYESEVRRLVTGCCVRVEGELRESPGKGQAVEVLAKKVDVLGWVEDPDTYPLQKKRHTMEFLREVAHLRPRSNTFGAVARVPSPSRRLLLRCASARCGQLLATPDALLRDRAVGVLAIRKYIMYNSARCGEPCHGGSRLLPASMRLLNGVR